MESRGGNGNTVGIVDSDTTASYSVDEFESPSNHNNSMLSPVGNNNNNTFNTTTTSNTTTSSGHSGLTKSVTSSLAVDLAIAVGLETPQEKIQRIENKIAELEKTEAETLSQLTIALQDNQNIVIQGTEEIQSLLAYAQQIISVELCATKATYQTLVECHRDVLYDIKECTQNMDIAWSNVQPKNEFMTLYEHDVNHFNRINPVLLHSSSSSSQPLQSLQQLLLDEKEKDINKDINVVSVTRTNTGTDFSSMTNAALDMMLNSGGSSSSTNDSNNVNGGVANGIDSADITPLADFHTINSDLIQAERQSRLLAITSSASNNNNSIANTATSSPPLVATIAPSVNVINRIGSSGESIPTVSSSFSSIIDDSSTSRTKSPPSATIAATNSSPTRRNSLLRTVANSIGRSNSNGPGTNAGLNSMSPQRNSSSQSPPLTIAVAAAPGPVTTNANSQSLSPSQIKSSTTLHQSQQQQQQQQNHSHSTSLSNSVSRASITPALHADSNDHTVSKDKEQQLQHELIKFGLSVHDKVIESFSCALYSRKGLGLTHGRMYVTKFFLAYQGWPETRLLLALTRITSFEKMNTLYYIPNAILIKEKSEEYFFGSFIDRDVCYTLLMNLAAVARTIDDINIRESAAAATAEHNHMNINTSSQSSTVNNMNTGIGSYDTNNLHNSTASNSSNSSISGSTSVVNNSNSGWETEERYAHLKFGIQKDGVSDMLTDIQTLTSSAVKSSLDNSNSSGNPGYNTSTSTSSRAIGTSSSSSSSMSMSLNNSVSNSRSNSARNIHDGSSTSETADYEGGNSSDGGKSMTAATKARGEGGGGMVLDRIGSVGELESNDDESRYDRVKSSTEDEENNDDDDGGRDKGKAQQQQQQYDDMKLPAVKQHSHQHHHTVPLHHHHHTSATKPSSSSSSHSTDFNQVGKSVTTTTTLTSATATSAQPPVKPHHSRKRGVSNASMTTFTNNNSNNNNFGAIVATTDTTTISCTESATTRRHRQSHSSSLPPFDFRKDCAKRNVDLLVAQAVLPVDVCDVYNCMWKQSNGYCGFLENQGDLDISGDEWTPVTNTTGDSLPSEDVCKFPFTHKRQCKYSHPRTTMLFIGPKNAPATQTHYLCTDMMNNNDMNNTSDNSRGSVVGNYALILTITQFEGIPMADCFKVLQYWYFQHNPTNTTDISPSSSSPSSSSSSTHVTVGLYIHYIKSTMLKSQVSSGVKEELLIMTKKWLSYVTDTIQQQIVDNIASSSSTISQISSTINTTTTTSSTQAVIIGSGEGGSGKNNEILMRADGVLQSSTTSVSSGTSGRSSRVNGKLPPLPYTVNTSNSSSSTCDTSSTAYTDSSWKMRVLMISLILLLLVFILMQFLSQFVLMKEIANMNDKLNQIERNVQRINQQLLKSSTGVSSSSKCPSTFPNCVP